MSYIRHGMYNTRPYRIWGLMVNRCTNLKNVDYFNYGGRGIKVCDRWRDFINFWEDMKDNYKPNLTLDRIDNNGNYEPSNCRWATQKQQHNNKRNNHLIEIEGEKDTITNWCYRKGLNRDLVTTRINRGMSAERAFTNIRYRINK